MVHYTGNYWPHLNSGPPNGQLYSLTGKKYNLWPHFLIGPPNGPLYWLTGEKCHFLPHLDSRLPNGPLYRLTGEKYNVGPILAVFCHLTTKCSPILVKSAVFGPTFRVGQQMVNLSFKIGGGFNGPFRSLVHFKANGLY